MPPFELERTVRPSLLDRLTVADDELDQPSDRPLSRDESADRFRDSVLRDVEQLLNARRTPFDVERVLGARHASQAANATPSELDELDEVQRSVYQYGLPDTLALPIATREGRQLLVRWIEQTIAAFEPRLTDVRVLLAEADQKSTPQVRFTASAVLRLDPSPVRVLFDTVLDAAAGSYAVQQPAEGAA